MATWWLYWRWGWPSSNRRAKPKSAIFKCPVVLISRFAGFRSFDDEEKHVEIDQRRSSLLDAWCGFHGRTRRRSTTFACNFWCANSSTVDERFESLRTNRSTCIPWRKRSPCHAQRRSAVWRSTFEKEIGRIFSRPADERFRDPRFPATLWFLYSNENECIEGEETHFRIRLPNNVVRHTFIWRGFYVQMYAFQGDDFTCLAKRKRVEKAHNETSYVDVLAFVNRSKREKRQGQMYTSSLEHRDCRCIELPTLSSYRPSSEQKHNDIKSFSFQSSLSDYFASLTQVHRE